MHEFYVSQSLGSGRFYNAATWEGATTWVAEPEDAHRFYGARTSNRRAAGERWLLVGVAADGRVWLQEHNVDGPIGDRWEHISS